MRVQEAMINWDDIETILLGQNIFPMDILLMKEFVRTLPFDDRQAVMRAMLVFPERLPFMLDILKKKRALADEYDASLAIAILSSEAKELETAQQSV